MAKFTMNADYKRMRNRYLTDPTHVRRVVNEKYIKIDQRTFAETKRWIPTSTYATMRSLRRSKRKGGAERAYNTINHQNLKKYGREGRYGYTRSRVARNNNKHHWLHKGYNYSIEKAKREGLL